VDHIGVTRLYVSRQRGSHAADDGSGAEDAIALCLGALLEQLARQFRDGNGIQGQAGAVDQ